MDDFARRVYEAVKKIPEGRVTNYGTVACAIGAPRSSRRVGWALHNNPFPGEVPCHRVVFKNGSLSSGFGFGGIEAQRALLVGEGVEVSEDFIVDMNKYGWFF